MSQNSTATPPSGSPKNKSHTPKSTKDVKLPSLGVATPSTSPSKNSVTRSPDKTIQLAADEVGKSNTPKCLSSSPNYKPSKPALAPLTTNPQITSEMIDPPTLLNSPDDRKLAPLAVKPVADCIVEPSETIHAATEVGKIEGIAVTTKAGECGESEETAVIRDESGNGTVTLIYEQYNQIFPIVDGSITQAVIDEEYCLSFVMPNCVIRLSHHPGPDRLERENRGVYDSLVHEEPRGTYRNLIKDTTYYVVVEQEEDQLRRDQEATKAKWAPQQQENKNKSDDGRGFESCSCIYGNPCVDEYGCKDWHGRFAIATANGWKGF